MFLVWIIVIWLAICALASIIPCLFWGGLLVLAWLANLFTRR